MIRIDVFWFQNPAFVCFVSSFTVGFIIKSEECKRETNDGKVNVCGSILSEYFGTGNENEKYSKVFKNNFCQRKSFMY